MEMPALDGIRNTAEVFDKLQAPAGTSCALQAAFLRNVLIQHEAMREQRTSSRSRMPAALVAPTTTVDTVNHQHPPTHAQNAQRLVVGPANDDQSSYHYESEDASTFDMNFVDDEAWEFIFANVGFNIGQGAFISPT
jgi:hypothetical protein